MDADESFFCPADEESRMVKENGEAIQLNSEAYRGGLFIYLDVK